MKDRREEQLDETLATGRRSSDPEVDGLVEQAGRVRQELSVPEPEARRQRALFVQGAAGRSGSLPFLRFLAPAAVVVAGLVALAGFSRTALPGQTLWPVREALSTVGLAASPEEEIDRRIDLARAQCREAVDLEISHPGQARQLVMGAIGDLQRARALSEDLDVDQRSTYLLAIVEMEDWTAELITEITERAEEGAGPTEVEDVSDDDREDNSGPGGDGSGDDNSGPGGGDDDSSGTGSGDDSDDDSSGPGSGDDSGDDSSGSGSDGSGGGDSSGSGSGGDDSSGSGSDGSGGGDSSGSGSGDDD